MKTEEMIRAALDCGAAKAVVIEREQIAMSAEFRKICEKNSCGSYGKSWTCPPGAGDVEETMARIRGFDCALWYQTIGSIEDSFDYEGMMAAGELHSKTAQRVHSAITPLLKGAYRHLSCGNCALCETCARRENLPCRHPDRALPAMEGWGVDVYNTTKDTPLKYINGQNSVTYFGMLLFTREDHE